MGACNLWECSHPGCTRSAKGVGPAFGLRAIGWYFTYGGPLFCPDHRPDGIPCDQEDGPRPCSQCKAEQEANEIQRLIVKHLNLQLPPWALQHFMEPENEKQLRKESKDHSDPTKAFPHLAGE